MCSEWIQVFYSGNEWSNTTVFVDPNNEQAMICSTECTYWGYHDESEWNKEEEIVTIERALARVYPDEKAISAILSNTKKDYSAVLDQLAKK